MNQAELEEELRRNIALQTIWRDCKKIADFSKSVMGSLPLRIEVSRDKWDWLKRYLDHEIVTDHKSPLPGSTPLPHDSVDVCIIPHAPPDFWRVVYRCSSCDHRRSLTEPFVAMCPVCHNTREVCK